MKSLVDGIGTLSKRELVVKTTLSTMYLATQTPMIVFAILSSNFDSALNAMY